MFVEKSFKFLTDFNQHANEIQMINYIRKEIRQLKGYSLASYPEAIKLNQNEIPYDVPGLIKAKVLEKLVLIPWNRYPLSQAFSLKERLSQALNWPVEGILVSNGSNVLIQAIMLATSVGEQMLTLDPTFSLYEIEAKVLGNKVSLVRLREDFSFPKEAFLKSMTNFPPSVIFLANPNAPTGNLFPKEDLLEVIKKARCLVVVDEAYCQFADYNLLEELSNYKNLVLLRTFSKALGLGGVRIGFALAHPEIAQEISKLLLPYCVNSISEIIAEAILEHPEVVEKNLAEIKRERAVLYQSLSNIEGVQVYPSQTNFLVFQVKNGTDTFNALLKEGVLVRNVSHPSSLPNTLRVTVGTPEENQIFVRVLRKILSL